MTLGPGDDWEEAPAPYYGEGTLEALPAQSTLCVWCVMEGVVDAPESILMYKGTIACTDHVSELLEAGSQ